MVASCCAYNCKEKSVKGTKISFHSFPINEKRRKLWEAAIRRQNYQVTNSSKICSRHFTDDCFDDRKFGGTWLKPDAIPTIFDFSYSPSKKNKKLLNPSHTQNSAQKRAQCSSDDSPEEGEVTFGADNSKGTGHGSLTTSGTKILKPEDLHPDGGLSGSLVGRENRRYFLGDFHDDDMDCPDKARQALGIAKEVVMNKTKSIKILKMACRRYENKIAQLSDRLTVATKRLSARIRAEKSEATSVNHDVSASLELELTTADSASDPEITIKEEPVWESEEGGSSGGYQSVYDPSTSTADSTSCPGASSTITPSVASVTSLAKPNSGEILGVPVGEFSMLVGPVPSQSGVSGDSNNSSATNGVLEKVRLQTNPANESVEETKVVPEYRTRDQFDVYGEYIASKLRRLDWRTCAYVQKAFGDIIFQAEMGKYNKVDE